MNARPILRFGLFVLIGLCLASRPASSQVLKGSKPLLNVKLGLWENTVVTQMAALPPFDTSRMTPEQKARMEAAMQAARQHASAPHTLRSCLTREKFDKALLPDNDRSCKYTVTTNSPAVYAVKVDCGGERPTSGDWRFEALTPESIKGTGKLTIGKDKTPSTSTMTAKWIGASCGDVK